MIIIKLIGGLGNQMFQYALGRSISLQNRVEFKIDISSFEEEYFLHKYGLDSFNITAEIATVEDIKKYKNPTIIDKIFQKIDNYKPYYTRYFITEKLFSFDPKILTINHNSYIEGYWVSEKYFNFIEKTIRSDFTIIKKPDENNKQIADEINCSESVSVHIRRGDYVNNPTTNEVHGTCSHDYYLTAAHLINQKINNPKFYIFSDDHEWVKQNFSLPYPYKFISINGAEKNYEDLRLMSLCKHNIIANSTFSWWGAWLNYNKQKIIIAPKKWFNEGYYNDNDIIPEKWIRI